MATSSSSSKICLKLLVNMKAKKVLFADANKDFVFCGFSLPNRFSPVEVGNGIVDGIMILVYRFSYGSEIGVVGIEIGVVGVEIGVVGIQIDVLVINAQSGFSIVIVRLKIYQFIRNRIKTMLHRKLLDKRMVGVEVFFGVEGPTKFGVFGVKFGVVVGDARKGSKGASFGKAITHPQTATTKFIKPKKDYKSGLGEQGPKKRRRKQNQTQAKLSRKNKTTKDKRSPNQPTPRASNGLEHHPSKFRFKLGFLLFNHIPAQISSNLTFSKSEATAKSIRLRQDHIDQSVTEQTLRNSERGKCGLRTVEVSNLRSSKFVGLDIDILHQPQTFLQILSVKGHLKKQWSKDSSSEPQKRSLKLGKGLKTSIESTIEVCEKDLAVARVMARPASIRIISNQCCASHVADYDPTALCTEEPRHGQHKMVVL
ncbi:hypothetical protein OSB04_026562 [Centaurea solstitialis]|uniref:Uncharacterized protein n=1 Tax=Centaurea solstitialis TaxID=347529 RepID=A0AA38SP66_9ASTR|nr:hypothetical protein OSB04_026562 [Centaurea solstitialis]